VHDRAVPERDADQVTDFHLAETQGNVAPTDLTADLDDAGRLADAAVTDHAGGQIGVAEDLRQYRFHLGDVHREASPLVLFI